MVFQKKVHSFINHRFLCNPRPPSTYIVSVASGAKIGNRKRLTWFCLWDNKSTLHRSLVEKLVFQADFPVS